MNLPIKFRDDKKQKWQSVEALLEVGDALASIYIIAWGVDDLVCLPKLAQVAIEAINSYKHPETILPGLCMGCGKQTLNLHTHQCGQFDNATQK